MAELLIAVLAGVGVGSLVLSAERWWDRNQQWIFERLEIPTPTTFTDLQLPDDALLDWGATLYEEEEGEILG